VPSSVVAYIHGKIIAGCDSQRTFPVSTFHSNICNELVRRRDGCQKSVVYTKLSTHTPK